MKLSEYRDLALTIIGAGVLIYIAIGACTFEVFHDGKTDFIHYYKASIAIINQSNIYASGIGGYIYPPLFACLLIPLAYLTFSSAAMVWIAINFLLLILCLTIGFKIIINNFKMQFTPVQALAACGLAIILSYDSLHWEILLGQADLLVLLGITLALYWLDKRPWLAGILLGFTVNIKYYSLVFLPFLCLRGRWKAAAGILAGTVCFALFPVIILGWKSNWHYLEISLRGLFAAQYSIESIGQVAKVPMVTWYRNVTITSGLTRIFSDHGWSVSSLYVTLLGLFFMVFLSFWRMFNLKGVDLIWRKQSDEFLIQIEFYTLLGCLLVFSPQNTLRHFLLLLIVNLIAAVMLLNPIPGVKHRLIAAGIIIMELGRLRFFQPRHHAIWHYIGGPGWALLLFVFIITYYQLKIYAQSKELAAGEINSTT